MMPSEQRTQADEQQAFITRTVLLDRTGLHGQSDAARTQEARVRLARRIAPKTLNKHFLLLESLRDKLPGGAGPYDIAGEIAINALRKAEREFEQFLNQIQSENVEAFRAEQAQIKRSSLSLANAVNTFKYQVVATPGGGGDYLSVKKKMSVQAPPGAPVLWSEYNRKVHLPVDALDMETQRQVWNILLEFIAHNDLILKAKVNSISNSQRILEGRAQDRYQPGKAATIYFTSLAALQAMDPEKYGHYDDAQLKIAQFEVMRQLDTQLEPLLARGKVRREENQLTGALITPAHEHSLGSAHGPVRNSLVYFSSIHLDERGAYINADLRAPDLHHPYAAAALGHARLWKQAENHFKREYENFKRTGKPPSNSYEAAQAQFYQFPRSNLIVRLTRKIGAGTESSIFQAIDRDGKMYAIGVPRHPEADERYSLDNEIERVTGVAQDVISIDGRRVRMMHSMASDLDDHFMGPGESIPMTVADLDGPEGQLNPGVLQHLPQRFRPLRMTESQQLKYDYFYQAARQVQLLHMLGCVHNDLKGANFLISSDGQVQVIDFGTATITPPGSKVKKISRKDPSTPFVGTSNGYCAYEAQQTGEHQYLSPQSDIHSLGVMAIIDLNILDRADFQFSTVLRTYIRDAGSAKHPSERFLEYFNQAIPPHRRTAVDQLVLRMLSDYSFIRPTLEEVVTVLGPYLERERRHEIEQQHAENIRGIAQQLTPVQVGHNPYGLLIVDNFYQTGMRETYHELQKLEHAISKLSSHRDELNQVLNKYNHIIQAEDLQAMQARLVARQAKLIERFEVLQSSSPNEAAAAKRLLIQTEHALKFTNKLIELRKRNPKAVPPELEKHETQIRLINEQIEAHRIEKRKLTEQLHKSIDRMQFSDAVGTGIRNDRDGYAQLLEEARQELQQAAQQHGMTSEQVSASKAKVVRLEARLRVLRDKAHNREQAEQRARAAERDAGIAPLSRRILDANSATETMRETALGSAARTSSHEEIMLEQHVKLDALIQKGQEWYTQLAKELQLDGQGKIILIPADLKQPLSEQDKVLVARFNQLMQELAQDSALYDSVSMKETNDQYLALKRDIFKETGSKVAKLLQCIKLIAKKDLLASDVLQSTFAVHATRDPSFFVKISERRLMARNRELKEWKEGKAEHKPPMPSRVQHSASHSSSPRHSDRDRGAQQRAKQRPTKKKVHGKPR